MKIQIKKNNYKLDKQRIKINYYFLLFFDNNFYIIKKNRS